MWLVGCFDGSWGDLLSWHPGRPSGQITAGDITAAAVICPRQRLSGGLWVARRIASRNAFFRRNALLDELIERVEAARRR
jgi:hypothetical protein